MIKLDYICFCNQLTGFSLAARNYIQALIQSNKYDIKITPLDYHNGSNTKLLYPESWKYHINKPEDDDRIKIYHCIPSLFRRVRSTIRKNKREIAFATFESYIAPEDWMEKLSQFPAIIVPSRHCYKVFNRFEEKSFYCPHILDTSLYTPRASRMPRKPFKLLWIGTWKQRKNYDILVEAFNRIKDIELHIKTDDYQKAEKYTKNHKNIIIHKNQILEEEMPAFIKGGFDACISCSSGEGFGLFGLQAIALKVPLICSDTTGCQDYASEHSCQLIYSNGVKRVKNMDGLAQFRDCLWDNFNADQVEVAIRNVVNDYDLAIKRAENAYQVFLHNFTYERFLGRFETCLKETFQV